MIMTSLVAHGFGALKCLLYACLYQMSSFIIHTKGYEKLLMKRYLDVVLPGLME